MGLSMVKSYIHTLIFLILKHVKGGKQYIYLIHIYTTYINTYIYIVYYIIYIHMNLYTLLYNALHNPVLELYDISHRIGTQNDDT